MCAVVSVLALKNILIAFMGGRKKMRELQEKYIERRKSTVSRIVSLPLSSYIDGHVNSTKALYSRLTSISLPSTWIISNVTSMPITLCKLVMSSNNMSARANVLITITIHANMKWDISFIHSVSTPKTARWLNNYLCQFSQKFHACN